jgi:hypothetical protein
MEKGQLVKTEYTCVVCRSAVKGSDIDGGDYPSNPECRLGHTTYLTETRAVDERRVIGIEPVSGAPIFEEVHVESNV